MHLVKVHCLSSVYLKLFKGDMTISQQVPVSTGGQFDFTENPNVSTPQTQTTQPTSANTGFDLMGENDFSNQQQQQQPAKKQVSLIIFKYH